MGYRSIVAAVVAAQAFAAISAQAQQRQGSMWKLMTGANTAPRVVYAMPSYASLANLEVFCKGNGAVGVRVRFKGPPLAWLKVSSGAKSVLLGVGPGGVLPPDDAQNFLRIFAAVDEEAKHLRLMSPGAPVVAEAMVADINVNVDDLTAIIKDFDKACAAYVPGATPGTAFVSDKRLLRSWIAPNGQSVVNFNDDGHFLMTEVVTRRESRGNYKTDGSTLWVGDMECGYRFDTKSDMVISNCNWAGTWMSDANYYRGLKR